MSFEELYDKVRSIVLKSYKDYHLDSWTVEDWEQEGRLILHQLIEQHAYLVEHQDLYRYFKTKFRNHILDLVRKQESDKRKFNKPHYAEVSEIGHRLKANGMNLDDLVLFRAALQDYHYQLSPEGKLQYEFLIQGKSFKGRKQLLRKMRQIFVDYNPYA